MSDTPLFQDADAQEAAYAPQELPADNAAQSAADVEARDTGLVGSGTGALVSSGETATAGGAGQALGAAAMANETSDEEDAVDRQR